MSELQEQIFNAIDIITEERMKQLSFNNCIEGIISSSTQNADGSYNFSYQGTTMSAFPMGNVSYKQGDIVYIMTINGDMSKKKVIVTLRSPSGQQYVDIEAQLAAISGSGVNYVTTTDDIILYSGTSERPITIASGIVKGSYAQTFIRISAEITTNLKTVVDADYGISIDLKFEDNTTKTYSLTLNEITGNPYITSGKKTIIEEFYLTSVVDSVVSAKVYINGFPVTDTSEYVKFSKIRIEFIDDSIADLATKLPYRLEVVSSNGLTFKNGNIITTLSAKLYYGPDDVTSKFEDSRFIWTRTSSDVSEDEAWNNLHLNGSKSIFLTRSDVTNKATFNCSIT